jgi:FlaA1/EpsC-like NDP-sugar epimerase
MSKAIERAIRHRRPFVVAAHLGLFAIAYELAYLLRFDFSLPAAEGHRLLWTIPWLLALRLSAFWFFHLYEGLWRYTSVRDLVQLLKGVSLSTLGFVPVALALSDGFPRSVLILDWVLTIGLTAGLRIALRLLLEHRLAVNGAQNASNGSRKRAIVVGTGDVAEALVREILRGALPYRVVGLVSDDPRLRGRRLHGLPVLGAPDEISSLCTDLSVSEVLFASPDASPAERRAIVESCATAHVRLKSVPAVAELLQGRAAVGQLQDVRFEELMGRAAVGTEVERLRAELNGRRVLVTGGAGSIGSELARQIASFDPEALVILDRAESDLYFTHLELRERFPDVKIEAVVGDICDERRVRQVMKDYAPELVYHAAAYKHVPLMEAYPLEAIKNNVLGTEVIAKAAIEIGARKFVLISTDKAVRPVGVMGMTKRAAEMLIQTLSGLGTTFVAVRFGNVLGSNGSVLPLFQKQIAEGSPVTITDPEASRYFMLTSEAVELVLQAGALGADGEVYVLNMGEPIRIGELAENLIRLSGLEPEVEVPIRITGLRPGERLTEELLVEEHEVRPGPHEKIYVVRDRSLDADRFLIGLDVLRGVVEVGQEHQAVDLLRSLVGVDSVLIRSIAAG